MSIHYINNGSLTSIFTPASSCLATILDGSTFRLPGQESSAGCFPSRLGLYRVRQTAAFFSPGRCPASYTAYTVTTVLSLAPSEHVYNCCPLCVSIYKHLRRFFRSCPLTSALVISQWMRLPTEDAEALGRSLPASLIPSMTG